MVNSTEWRCPRCGTAYAPEVKFCTHCRSEQLLKQAKHPANNAGFGIFLLGGLIAMPLGAVVAVATGLPAVPAAIICAVVLWVLMALRASSVRKQKAAAIERPN